MPPKKRGRKPNIKPELRDMGNRAAYIAQIEADIRAATSDIGRMSGLKLLGQARGYLQAEIPSKAPSVPTDRLAAARWWLSWIRKRIMVSSGIALTQLLAREERLVAEIASLQPEAEATHEEEIASLVAEIGDWPDEALQIAAAEARRRGLP